MFDCAVRLTRTRHGSFFIAGSLLTLTFMSLVLASLTGAQGGKMDLSSVQKSAPAVIFIEQSGSEVELRRQLRAKNGVFELGFSSSVTPFSVARPGSFGFISPKLLGMALITRSPDLPLELIAPTSNAFEIHKLADGTGMLVGFVEAHLKPQLTPSQRPENVRFGLYSNRSEKASQIVAVPLATLIVDRMPTRLDPKEPGSAVLLNVDLQNSANRMPSQPRQ
jgi:hypothetical protein